MSKRILVICNTPLILINFMNLSKKWDLSDKQVDIILTDESIGMQENAQRLKKLNLYNNVFYIKVREKYKGGNFLKKIRKIFYVFEGKNKAKNFNVLNEWRYDEFFFSLYDILSNQIYQIILKENPNIICNRYEEGYVDYVLDKTIPILSTFMYLSKFLLNKRILEDNVAGYYLYHPDWLERDSNTKLYEMELHWKEDKSFLNQLNLVFGYTNQADEFQKKYVFFEECFSVDKNDIKDYEIIKQVIEQVGLNNVLVKLHPRNDIERFENIGVLTSKCRIPWEVIMLNGDFSNTTFLSISSGSIVNLLSWGIQTKCAVLLFDMLEKKPRLCTQAYRRFVNKAIDLSGEESAFLPKTLSDLKIICEKGNNYEDCGVSSN